MNYLFFGGAPRTGKSEAIWALANHLVQEKGYAVIEGNIPADKDDFQCILQKGGRLLLIHSYTDLPWCVEKMIGLYRTYPGVHVVVSSIRDEGDWMRAHLLGELGLTDADYVLEIPLAKITRRNSAEESIAWYKKSIIGLTKSIIARPPFEF